MGNEVEEIKARLNIVELIGAYVKLQKAGSSWKACCPFHHEKTPSFNVNEERQMWHCFGCSKGGDVFAFLMEIEGVDFKEALKLLAERAGVELPKFSRASGEGKSRAPELLELATKFYEKQLWEGSGGKKVLEYLRGRGLNDESMRRFRLGYAPAGWRHLLDFLTKREYTETDIEKAGLIIKKKQESIPNSIPLQRDQLLNSHYDRFRDRIMFPIQDILGRVIGYSARVAPGGDETQAKYINTPETAVYRKSRVLYGIHLAKQAMKVADSVLLVEGNTDVVALHQVGLANAAAVSGTALTGEQLNLIKRYTHNIRLFFDMDGAGQTAARKSTELAMQADFNVSIVAIPSGKDAAELAQNDAALLRAAVEEATPAPEYFLQRLLEQYDQKTPEGKRRIADDYLGLIASVAHPVVRSTWVKRLAEAIQVEEKVLASVVLNKFPNQGSKGVVITPETQSQPVSPEKQTSFEKRTEKVRRHVFSLALLHYSGFQKMMEESGETEKVYLSEHPMAAYLRQWPADQPFVFSEWYSRAVAPARKTEVAALVFEGEKMLEGRDFPDEKERGEYIEGLLRSHRDELKRELVREKMLELEREMQSAERSGDKEREYALRETLNQLVQQLTS